MPLAPRDAGSGCAERALSSRRARDTLRRWLVAGTALGMTSCIGPTERPFVPVPRPSNDYAAAGVVAGVGAVLYATAGGCKISGCPTGTYCDPGSERCVRVECTLANEAEVCASGTRCDLRSGTCVAF